jgi:hypothetical protein
MAATRWEYALLGQHQLVRACVKLADQDRRVDLNIAKAGARRRERGLGETCVGETCYLLRRCTKDVRGDVAKVPELGVVDRHGQLLAQAAQRLAVLLSEPAALLGTLTIGAGETAR